MQITLNKNKIQESSGLLPAVMDEYAADYFEIKSASPFILWCNQLRKIQECVTGIMIH
jgi:hypothetical protein